MHYACPGKSQYLSARNSFSGHHYSILSSLSPCFPNLLTTGSLELNLTIFDPIQCPHFIDEKTEVQRSRVICPSPHRMLASEQRGIPKSSGTSPGGFLEHAPRNLGIPETSLRNFLSSQNPSHGLQLRLLLTSLSPPCKALPCSEPADTWAFGSRREACAGRGSSLRKRHLRTMLCALRGGDSPWNWQPFLYHHSVTFLLHTEGSPGSAWGDRRGAKQSPRPGPPSRGHFRQRLSERDRCGDRLF